MLGLKGFDLRMGVGMMSGFAPPLSFGHFPRERGQPGPLATPFALTLALTLALSHRGRGNYWHTLTRDPLLIFPWEGEVKAGEGRGDLFVVKVGVGGGDGSFGCLVGRGRFQTCPYEGRGLRRSQGASCGPSPLDGRSVRRAAGFRRKDVDLGASYDVNMREDVNGLDGVDRQDGSEVWCYGT